MYQHSTFSTLGACVWDPFSMQPCWVQCQHRPLPNKGPKGKEKALTQAFSGFNSYLSQTLRTPPVPLGDVVEWWNQAKGMIAIVTAITQQKAVLLVATATQEADIQVHLWTQHIFSFYIVKHDRLSPSRALPMKPPHCLTDIHGTFRITSPKCNCKF